MVKPPARLDRLVERDIWRQENISASTVGSGSSCKLHKFVTIRHIKTNLFTLLRWCKYIVIMLHT